jgi:hypothetical protein
MIERRRGEERRGEEGKVKSPFEGALGLFLF